MPSGQYDQIQVVGTGATAIRDIAGNILSGNGSGAAGSNYVASFAQGTRLQYVDNTGNLVTLHSRERVIWSRCATLPAKASYSMSSGWSRITRPSPARSRPARGAAVRRTSGRSGPRPVRRRPRAAENAAVPREATPLPAARSRRLVSRRRPAMTGPAGLTIRPTKGYSS